MSIYDLVRAAVGNSFRSMGRTMLTVVAIVIGAFTLTLTNGVGNGISSYIDSTISAIGASDVLTITKAKPDGTGPQRYDPNKAVVSTGDGGPDESGTVTAITTADLAQLQGVDGVDSVAPVLTVRPDYVAYGGGLPYQLSIGGLVPGTTLQLAAGVQPQWDSTQRQMALPESFVAPLGFRSDADAVGTTITLGVTDATGKRSTLTATVVGVAAKGLVGGDVASANHALTQVLYERQSVGLSTTTKQNYAEAIVRFPATDSAAQVAQLKTRLADLGYEAQTVDDQIGSFKSVIDAVVLVLDGFAVIALLAAGFGIVNTMMMSVRERTREIGLMKAMGLGSGRIFGLFSLEAVFIGLLGSALGVGLAIGAGAITNTVLAGNLLANLPGLTLLSFPLISVAVIVSLILAIAFLAGTTPALRGARQDPIESLHYE